MSNKKKVGLAGVMGMQSKPVQPAPQAKKSKPKTPKSVNAKTSKTSKKVLAKSKDQDFKLTGIYLRKTTVGQVKAKLELQEEDMSELIEELLAKWLKTV